MADLKISIGKLELQNPVITASGTFGYGEEFADFVDLNRLGGIIVKGITLEAREGNPYPRMAETASGMLNAVGLQNRGIEYFITEIYPELAQLRTRVMVNINGSGTEDYVALAQRLQEFESIHAVEVNISCPNVKMGGMAFGTSSVAAAEVTRAVRAVWRRTMIVKLSPNVTHIAEIAKSVESEGADAVSLVNTFLGMAIDPETRRPRLSTITGGLSGPAIKPIALRMVWQTSKVVKIPVIGIGGIMNAEDAIEFMLAGAAAIQVGTANFIDPQVSIKIIEGINDYLDRHKVTSVKELTGALEC